MAKREERSLTILTILGALSAGWGLFLWRELIRARHGEEPFCGFGGGDCSTLWNGSLASSIHDGTGVPVAGWGLLWGLVACLLPLAARLGWWRRGDAQRWSLRVVALAGIGSVVMLVAASVALRMLCTSCLVTYVLVLAYVVVAFLGLPEPSGGLVRGAVVALLATAVGYLGLLYPGLQTPKSVSNEGNRVLAEQSLAQEGRESQERQTPPGGEASSEEPMNNEDRLQALIASLSPELQQALSDSLAVYARSPQLLAEAPRALQGSADAPVMITDFTDALCGHCATLHQTLDYMRGLLPPGSFSIDSRQFPLDSDCNPFISGPREDDVRCLAALAQICMEDLPRAHEFSGELFREQATLTEGQVVALGARYRDRSALEECMASAATGEKLKADLEYAARYQPQGTPLVLINGRQAPHFGPFLYAMALTGGAVDHPLFAQLPPPRRFEGGE